jgi:hypothetical protein
MFFFNFSKKFDIFNQIPLLKLKIRWKFDDKKIKILITIFKKKKTRIF